MAQYIDKGAVVAEIEKTINKPYPKHDQQCNWEDGYCSGLYKAWNIIEDTLEVKEVNIDEEFDKCCENYIFDDECEVYTAKHFFELGLKANQKLNK